MGKPFAALNLGTSLNICSHLVNDGVEESPPSRAWENGEGSNELFTNLSGANVGFKHWHPVAVTANGNKLTGQADMGGVWEWTSSPLEKHESFEPMPLYPGYTGTMNSLEPII
jgi:formylglycine-generating enzyme required for sulfatase activity